MRVYRSWSGCGILIGTLIMSGLWVSEMITSPRQTLLGHYKCHSFCILGTIIIKVTSTKYIYSKWCKSVYVAQLERVKNSIGLNHYEIVRRGIY